MQTEQVKRQSSPAHQDASARQNLVLLFSNDGSLSLLKTASIA